MRSEFSMALDDPTVLRTEVRVPQPVDGPDARPALEVEVPHEPAGIGIRRSVAPPPLIGGQLSNVKIRPQFGGNPVLRRTEVRVPGPVHGPDARPRLEVEAPHSNSQWGFVFPTLAKIAKQTIAPSTASVASAMSSGPTCGR
jgi:hypothetical protein